MGVMRIGIVGIKPECGFHLGFGITGESGSQKTQADHGMGVGSVFAFRDRPAQGRFRLDDAAAVK